MQAIHHYSSSRLCPDKCPQQHHLQASNLIRYNTDLPITKQSRLIEVYVSHIAMVLCGMGVKIDLDPRGLFGLVVITSITEVNI